MSAQPDYTFRAQQEGVQESLSEALGHAHAAYNAIEDAESIRDLGLRTELEALDEVMQRLRGLGGVTDDLGFDEEDVA